MKKNSLKTLILLTAISTSIVGCKTSQTSTTADSDTMVNYFPKDNYSYPLADTAFKYSNQEWLSDNLDVVMNEKVKSMMPNLEGKATIMQFGEGIIVSLDRGNVFGVNDVTLNENTKNILRHLSFNLQQDPDTYILVVGRTDATGTREYNESLAYNRASVVANYLHGTGVDKDRLFVDTFGEKFPDFTNRLAAGRELNRRVDFLILPSNYLRETASSK